MNLKKELSGVAEAVAKVMEAELSPKQKAIAKLAEPKHKIDSGDLAKLRAGHKPVEEGYYKDIDTNRKEDERLAAQKKKQLPFTPDKPGKKVATAGKFGYGYSAARHLARQGMAGVTKEETDQIVEDVTVKKDYDDNEQSEHGVYKGKKQIGYVVHNKKENTHTAYHGPQGKDDFGHIDDFPDHNKAVSQIKKSAGIKEDIQKTSSGYIHHARPGVYGGSEKEKHVVDTLRGPKKSELNAIEKEKKMKKSFSEMLDLINTHGLKALSEMIKEEPDNEQFTKELKDQEAKAAGKKKQADIAKGSVQAVKVEEDVERVEMTLGEASTYKLGRAATETKDFPIHHNGEQVGKLEFHTSAGKLYHRVSSVAGVPYEKFIGHPDREKMTNSHVEKHEAEARKHFAKKIKEETEQLDELSPKTLGSYIKKAHRSGTDDSFDHGDDEHRQYGDPDDTEREKEMQDRERAIANREKGIHRAVKRLTKENIQERSLTEPEMKKKEEIVKSMKKGLAGFKARYGDRAKEVMYATATKRAMGEEAEQIDEASKKPDSHGVVILKKTHEVPSHVVHGEQGKNYTLHLHDVYHQKPGKKEKKLGQIESNIHNKDDENEAHIVSRHKDGEDFHMETHHAIEHLMNMHKINLNTPIKKTKAPNFKKGSTDDLPDYL